LDSISLRFIDVAHPDYPAELELRFRVLREPLGKTRDEVAFPFEKESLHLVAVEDGAVVGCVLFNPEGPRSGRLFQMAVSPAMQGRGLGARLVRRLELELVERGVTHVHLHARASVVPFYEKLGYRTRGDPYEELGVPHRNMERDL